LTEAKIRKMTIDDIGAVTEIYNEAILSTTATFDIETKSPEDRKRWFLAHGSKHPVLVSEIGGSVVGWASLSRWSDRGAYDKTAEVSVYVDGANRGKGVGKSLLSAIVEEGRKAGFHTLTARIVAGNDQSVKLVKSFSFDEIGTLREVGYKFGKYHDVIYLQKIFNPKSDVTEKF
jgi:phosphinothricin acetyltransferase